MFLTYSTFDSVDPEGGATNFENFFAFLDKLEYFKKVWFLSEKNPPTQSKCGKNHT